MKTYINKYKAYLEKAGKSPYTVQAYVRDIEQLFEYLKISKIADATEQNIKKYTTTLKKANYDLKSVSRKINSIRSFFRFLMEDGSIQVDPAQNVHHPKIKEETPRYLTKDEYTKLRVACEKDLRTNAMIELLLQTGMRIGELCRLKIGDIKYKSQSKPQTIFIEKYQSTPARLIPLNSAAIEALQRYLDTRGQINKDDYLFSTRSSKPIIIRNARTYICRTIKKAKIHNATVNDLRNTFIFHHLKNGTNILTLSQIVGHKNLSSTIKYTRIKKSKNSPKAQITLKNL